MPAPPVESAESAQTDAAVGSPSTDSPTVMAAAPMQEFTLFVIATPTSSGQSNGSDDNRLDQFQGSVANFAIPLDTGLRPSPHKFFVEQFVL